MATDPVFTLQPDARLGVPALNVVGTSGIFLSSDTTVDSILPVPSWEESFAESQDTEGGRRVRTRPMNANGNASVVIDSAGSGLWANVARWEAVANAMNAGGGEIIYAPTNGTPVTYDVQSFHLTSMPQNVVHQKGGVAMSEFEFTVLPFGRLGLSSIISNETSTSPLLTVDIPALDGSADALGFLIITDAANQARSHVEWGLESRYFDVANPWDLLIDQGDLTAMESATETTRSGSYSTNVYRQTLDTSSTGVAYATGSHVGRFRIKGRFYASAAGVSVRLAYEVRGGGQIFKPWVPLPVDSAWCEVDLGAVNLPPPASWSGWEDYATQVVQFYVFAKAAASTPTVDVDYLKAFPAERYGKMRGSVGSVATIQSGENVIVRHDGMYATPLPYVYTRHPGATGSYLTIPPKGGRLAVAANRNDIDAAAHTPLGDNLRVDLDVTPRVALLGA